jgi:hypothetical protein
MQEQRPKGRNGCGSVGAVEEAARVVLGLNFGSAIEDVEDAGVTQNA